MAQGASRPLKELPPLTVASLSACDAAVVLFLQADAAAPIVQQQPQLRVPLPSPHMHTQHFVFYLQVSLDSLKPTVTFVCAEPASGSSKKSSS